MPPPMAQSTFDDINSELFNAYEETSQESMKVVAEEVQSKKTLVEMMMLTTTSHQLSIPELAVMVHGKTQILIP